MTELLAAQLRENIALITKAVGYLEQSYAKCKELTAPYPESALETVEAFTSRFARVADMATQCVAKSLLLYIGEPQKTFIDSAHMLEKLGVTEHAETLRTIRDLHNSIAHEYVTADTTASVAESLALTPALLTFVQALCTYAEQKLSQN
jgi:uncharacterized protein YutE (UPF0331/DUF86 family)